MLGFSTRAVDAAGPRCRAKSDVEGERAGENVGAIYSQSEARMKSVLDLQARRPSPNVWAAAD